jgi:hypothetical protein
VLNYSCPFWTLLLWYDIGPRNLYHFTIGGFFIAYFIIGIATATAILPSIAGGLSGSKCEAFTTSPERECYAIEGVNHTPSILLGGIGICGTFARVSKPKIFGSGFRKCVTA